MVGNIATEMLVAELTRMGATLGKLQPLDGLVAASAEIARRYGSKVQ
jgi:hydroxymethylglutaryl-CoA lyase